MSKIKFNEKGFFSKILNFKPFVLLSNIIFQAIPYMTYGEKTYKIMLTLFFSFLINLFLKSFILSLVLGHILNYILNGQFYVVYRYLGQNETMNKEKLIKFIDFILKLSSFFKPLDILFTGSFSKGQMTKQSDLDIRIFHEKGFVSSLSTYFMASILRFSALYMRFPIDIYCFSDLSFLGPHKISEYEVPVHVFSDEKIMNKYPESKNYKSQLNLIEIAKN